VCTVRRLVHGTQAAVSMHDATVSADAVVVTYLYSQGSGTERSVRDLLLTKLPTRI
jgi:hypothetical protein